MSADNITYIHQHQDRVPVETREIEYIDVAAVAKLIRRDLKLSFPQTKFSVRSERYSGGSSIDVRWTDGPTEQQVKQITAHYQGSHFDGQTDSSSSVYQQRDGRRVRYGADFVFTERRYSVAFLTPIANRVAEYHCVSAPEIQIEGNGSAYVPYRPETMVDGYTPLNDLVMREAQGIAEHVD